MTLQDCVKLANGVQMPQLGLGVYRSEGDDAVRAVEWALAAGYRHIDTARLYGNEAEVGRAIQSSGLPREDLFITTKLWNDDMRQGRQREAFEKSLAALDTGYVDLYLIHWPVENYLESWAILEDLYTRGLVKAIGVSNFQIHHMENLLAACKVAPMVNQVELHPYLAQAELAQWCKAHRVACEAYMPLGRKDPGMLKHPVLAQIAAAHGKSPAQVVLRWDLQRGIITIPKSANKARIEENADLYDFQLSRAEMDAINGMNANRRMGNDPDNFDF